MNRKTKDAEPVVPTAGAEPQAPTAGAEPQAPTADMPAIDRPAPPELPGEISVAKRAELRGECVKAAIMVRTAQTPISTLVQNAKEIEAYVLDPECHLPAPEPAVDEETENT